MKQLFVLSLFIAVLSACHEPLYENAFTEGEKQKVVPLELRGKFLMINRYLEGENHLEYSIDTVPDSVLVSSHFMGLTNDYTDTASLRNNPGDASNIDSLEMRYYKGVYYISMPVREIKTSKTYYKIYQLEHTVGGVQYKYINYDQPWMVEKLKKKLEYKRDIYMEDECWQGCDVGIFKHNHADMHEFFETEIPDSLSTLLVKVY